jgi:CheY-like chemotaxis protein
VILNLVTNASDALGDKGGTITVAVGTIEADEACSASTYFDDQLPAGSYSYLEVSDTGIGMSADEQRRIFEPFYTTKFTGRGLGLAAVSGIVRGHRGAIQLESHVERGTRIRVVLPASRKSDTSPSHEDNGAPGKYGAGTVLLVDDDDTARLVADSILCRNGFNVVSTQGGVQAVATFARLAHEICLVVLDTTRQLQGCEDTFRELRRIRPDVPVLLTSGYNKPDTASCMTGECRAGFIQKPYSGTKLMDKVRQVLGSARIDVHDRRNQSVL